MPTVATQWTEEQRDQPLRTIESDLIALLREVDGLKRRLSSSEEQATRRTKDLLLEMLCVLDAFDNVLANVQAKEKDADRQTRIWIGNFRAIRRLLARLLEQEGVVQIEAPSGKAVPGLHHIVETRENLDQEGDTILEEIEKGYLCRGEVLRKSKVITVKN